MSHWPVAAFVYLLNNPEARQAAKDIGGKIVTWIISGMYNLPGEIARAITGALPGQPGGTLPKHPQYGPPTPPKPYNNNAPGYASGGWVGMKGPEFVKVGEKGPEFVRKAGTGTGDGGPSVRIVGVSLAEIVDAVDRGLYFKLQRAAPTLGS